ncbi:hypothetical protein I8J30_19175 [Paenibacillus sp. DLE-14]|uniref:Uncharacterized protein n=2 Tax=Paenibacillus lignilyticus TaxID=1172615 RepID=A0ABS5CG34_9BACL|nr:hypothetical protein [Paenibacillus lignilyticus]
MAQCWDRELATLWTVGGGMEVTGSKRWIAGRLRTACAGQYGGGMTGRETSKTGNYAGRAARIGHREVLLSAVG